MKNSSLRVLFVDDSEDDFLLLLRELKKGYDSIEAKRVDTAETMHSMLSEREWDVVISDYVIPGFGGMEALSLYKSFDLITPFIMVSGKITEEMAVNALRAGANDFILKQNLARLLPAISRAIEQSEVNKQKKAADEQLRLFRTLLDHATDGIEVIEYPTFRILDVNETECNALGYSREELLSMTILDIDPLFTPENADKALKQLHKLGNFSFEGVHRRKDGSEFPVEIKASLVNIDKPYILTMARDITERKISADIIALQSQKLRLFIEYAPAAIAMLDRDFCYVAWSKRWSDLFDGYISVGKSHFDVIGTIESISDYAKVLNGEVVISEAQSTHLPGNKKVKLKRELQPWYTDDGTIGGIVIYNEDVTLKHEHEQQIKKLSRMYEVLSLCNKAIAHTKNSQLLFEQICRYTVENECSDMSWIGLIDPDTLLISPVASYGDRFHYLENLVISINPDLPEGRGPTGIAARENHSVWCENFLNDPMTAPWHEKGKESGWKLSVAIPITEDGKVIGVFNTYMSHCIEFDPMMQRLMEEMIADVSFAMGNFKREREGLDAHNDLIKTEKLLEEMSSLAMIGGWEIDVKTKKGICTHEAELICGTNSHAIDLNSGMNIFEGEARISFENAMQKILEDGTPFAIELPLKMDGEIQKWVRLMGYAIYESRQIIKVQGSIQDISLVKNSEKALHETLLCTIQAMASTVEMRDPYTAGHQRRVASLACAIADKMGMERDRIEGLRLASQIHDLGKIQVPAEILSKPTKLSDVEFMLLQSHPEAGYQTLKNINFPWPIADIIRQHHEKLDGTGYPHGLKGEEILLEARILTVADIVEAMATHRPYRPSLGIDTALQEIKSQSGIKLDRNVVEACCTLFKKEEFVFPK